MKTIIFTLFFTTFVIAQQTVNADIDGDKIIDKIVLTEINQGFKIKYSLSTENKNYNTKLISYGQNRSLSVKKTNIVLECNFMRAESTFKFRYNSKLKKVVLIGFDYVNYGGATHDGSGNLSYNLSTGNYVGNWSYFEEKKQELLSFPVIKKKLPLKNYYLTDFSDEQIDGLNDKLHLLLPKSIQ